jgi:hypothetical protein
MNDETWELVRTDRIPVIGEIRFIRKNVGATFDQIFKRWVQVVWNGREWIETQWSDHDIYW